MREFLDNFDIPNMHGLVSGEETGIEVARMFKNHISHEERNIKQNPELQINHNSFIYLFNPQGKLSLIYMMQKPDNHKIIKDIKSLTFEKQKRLSQVDYSWAKR